MNLRHAAALALGDGLMVPPSTLKSYPNPVDKTQPLSRWQKARRFDSEHDCHRALKRLVYEGENVGESRLLTRTEHGEEREEAASSPASGFESSC